MLAYLQMLLSQVTKERKGQDLTEYGLLVALIAIVVIIAVTVFGQEVSSFFSSLAATVRAW